MSHGGNKRNFQTYSPMEFIAAPNTFQRGWRRWSGITVGIRIECEVTAKPPKLLQDETEKTEVENDEVIVISNFRMKKIPPLVWRECIKKVWEVDPLLCSHCGGLMKIVSFIYEHRVIKKILAHLGLSEEAKSKRERAPPFPMFKRCDCMRRGSIATGQLTEIP